MDKIRSWMALPVLALSFSAAVAVAQSSLLDRWYTALFDVNRVAIADLLADDAVINLEDLGVSQTRDEFIASLDEWEEAVKDANIAWQLEEGAIADDGQATALVCYQFPDNELLIREVFVFRDGKIAGSTQTTAGDSCEAF